MDERLSYLLLGCFIGFILGFIVARLSEMKEELDEVSDILKKEEKDESGFMRKPLVADICFIVVLVIVVWAAVQTGKTSTRVQENQDTIAQITTCNQYFLIETIQDLNERTTFTVEQADLNVELQKAQSSLIALFLAVPPKSDEVQYEALRRYFETLTEFVVVSAKTGNKIENNPFATEKEVVDCFQGETPPEFEGDLNE